MDHITPSEPVFKILIPVVPPRPNDHRVFFNPTHLLQSGYKAHLNGSTVYGHQTTPPTARNPNPRRATQRGYQGELQCGFPTHDFIVTSSAHKAVWFTATPRAPVGNRQHTNAPNLTPIDAI